VHKSIKLKRQMTQPPDPGHCSVESVHRPQQVRGHAKRPKAHKLKY
jgi:hypothetical protein